MSFVKKCITAILLITISTAVTYFFTDKITKNSDLLMILTSVFSIFSGFIFLIIPLIGQLSLPIETENNDNSMIIEFNALIDLFWCKILFFGYLSAILLIFIFLMDFNELNHLFLKYAIVFISVILISISALLPQKLVRLTKESIERKRAELMK